MSIVRNFAIFSVLLLTIFNRPAEVVCAGDTTHPKESSTSEKVRDNQTTGEKSNTSDNYSNTKAFAACSVRVASYGFTGIMFKDCPIIIKVNILRGLLAKSKNGLTEGFNDMKSFIDVKEKTLTDAEENVKKQYDRDNNKSTSSDNTKTTSNNKLLKSLTADVEDIKSEISSFNKWCNLTGVMFGLEKESKSKSDGESTTEEGDKSENNSKEISTELKNLIVNEATQKSNQGDEIMQNINFIFNYMSHVESKTAKCSPTGKLIELYRDHSKQSNDYEAKQVASKLNLISSYCLSVNEK